MQPEGLLMCLQEAPLVLILNHTNQYLMTPSVRSTSTAPFHLRLYPFTYVSTLSPTSLSFHLCLFPSSFSHYFVLTCHLSYRSLPSDFPWADNPNNISWIVRITNVLIIHNLQPFRSKYSPQHPLPKHLPSMHFQVHEKAQDPLTKPHKTTENQTCKSETSLITNFNKRPIYFSYNIQTLPNLHNFRHTQL